jgi:sec-independent protein translocase protein TatA
MGELSPWHWIIVLLIFALLFGSKKLPDAARGLGRSMRIFKSEMSATDDDATAKGAAAVSGVIASPAPVTPSPAPEASPTSEPAPVEDAVPPIVSPVVTPEPVKQD